MQEARLARHGAQAIVPKIDLSHISKPGDVLKAILAKKKEEEEEARPRARAGKAGRRRLRSQPSSAPRLLRRASCRCSSRAPGAAQDCSAAASGAADCCPAPSDSGYCRARLQALSLPRLLQARCGYAPGGCGCAASGRRGGKPPAAPVTREEKPATAKQPVAGSAGGRSTCGTAGLLLNRSTAPPRGSAAPAAVPDHFRASRPQRANATRRDSAARAGLQPVSRLRAAW